MSAKGGSIGAILLGVVIGVAAIFTAGQSLWFYVGAAMTSGMMIAGGAYGLTLSSKNASQQGAAANQLEVSTASDGFPIPVVFGTQRRVGNFMNYSADTFKAEPIYDSSDSGGKGGAGSRPAPIVGYEYFLAYEYALCVGPVDEIGQVFSVPGETKLRHGADVSDPPEQAVFGGDDFLELELEGGYESGAVRIYKGSKTQSREVTGDFYAYTGMNYRNLCYVVYGLNEPFNMGRNAGPKTHSWVITRIPKPRRDDGSTIAGFQTRGSSDPEHPNYKQANVAAIYWEVLTEKLWARGLSSDVLDEASFVATSQWFIDRNIGLGITLETPERLTDFCEDLRRHTKTILALDGSVLKLRNLLDISLTHGNIQTLRESEIRNLKVNRPLWDSTKNGVRAEINNAERDYKPDTVFVQDSANVNVQGGKTNAQNISLRGFTDWNTARRQAIRLLSEVSYPLSTATFEMNRYKSQMEIGDVFRLIWSDWNGSPVTAYYQVAKLEDAESDAEWIKVSATEEITLPPVEGEELTVEVPDRHAWEDVIDIPYEDIAKQVEAGDYIDTITPVTAWEVPAVITQGKESRVVLLGEKNNPTLLTIRAAARATVQYAQYPGGPLVLTKTNTYNLGDSPSFAITGALLTAINNWDIVNRTTAGFEFSLTNPTLWESSLLSAGTLVTLPTDEFEDMLMVDAGWMVIGEELFQIGKITKVSSNRYKAQNFIRGRRQTDIVRHPIGQNVFFFNRMPPGVLTNAMTGGIVAEFQATPVKITRVADAGEWFKPFHEAPNNELFLNMSQRPPAPLPIRFDPDDNRYVQIRPRFYHKGAGSGDDFETIIQQGLSSLDGMSFEYDVLDFNGVPVQWYVWNRNGGTYQRFGPKPAPHVLVESDGFDPEKGIVKVFCQHLLNSGQWKYIVVYSVYLGKRSATGCVFNKLIDGY